MTAMIHDRALGLRSLLLAMVLCAVTVLGSSTRSFAQLPSKSAPGSNVGVASVLEATRSSRVAATDAERLIDDAIDRIAALDSVTADLVQTVEMLNQTFTISGRYLKAPGGRVYVRLAVADTDFQTLQVCDGETMWDFQDTLESRVFTRLSIKPILERLASPDLDRKTKELTTTQMGFAGAESLLVGLRKCYNFNVVEKEERRLDGIAVWIVYGNWTSAPSPLGPESRPAGGREVLPPYVPGNATLYLGKADLYPYKLVLVGEQPIGRSDTRRRGLNGEPIGARSSIEKLKPTRIVLTYSNVSMNGFIPDYEFLVPKVPGVVAADRTDAIVKSLDQSIRLGAERKKLEAARLEEPLAVPAIEIPVPPTDDHPMPR
jgi:outer membrane lipoprotein-sorting protein